MRCLALAIIALLPATPAFAFGLSVGPQHTLATSGADHSKLGVLIALDLIEGKSFELDGLISFMGMMGYTAVNPGSAPTSSAPDAGETKSGSKPFYAEGVAYPSWHTGKVQWGVAAMHFQSDMGARAGGIPMALGIAAKLAGDKEKGLSLTLPMGVDLIFNSQLNLISAPQLAYQFSGFANMRTFARAVLVKTSASFFYLPSFGLGFGF